MVVLNARVVDKTMLSVHGGEENDAEKDLQQKVGKFFDERWWAHVKGDAAHAAQYVPCKVAKAAGKLAKRKGKTHRYNLLGGSYVQIASKYEFGKSLGHGAYGKVYEVKSKESGGRFACKQMSKVKIFTEGSQGMAQNEIVILQHLATSDSLMALWEALEDEQYLYLIVELCEGGDVLGSVAKHFKEEGAYAESDAAELGRRMLRAVQFCHNNGVVHRDVKPENFLWTQPGSCGTLKLADFGLATFLPLDEQCLKDRCGTPSYMAPELWKKSGYRTEPDVWALGVTMAVLLTGKYPFKFNSVKECAKVVCEEEIDFKRHPWTLISLEARSLLSRMLEKNPNKRITIPEVLQHPWMREGGTAPSASLTTNLITGIKKLATMNQLHEVAMRLLAAHLKDEEIIQSSRYAFDQMDKDGDGMVPNEDFKALLVQWHKGMGITEEEETRLLATLDSDGKGYITFDDYMTGNMHMRSQANELHMMDAFKLFDTDGDYFISPEELTKAVGLVRMEVTDEIMETFRQLDLNGDGRVSLEEFSVFWNTYVRESEEDAKIRRRMSGAGASVSSDEDQIPVAEDASMCFLDGLRISDLVSMGTALTFAPSGLDLSARLE